MAFKDMNLRLDYKDYYLKIITAIHAQIEFNPCANDLQKMMLTGDPRVAAELRPNLEQIFCRLEVLQPPIFAATDDA